MDINGCLGYILALMFILAVGIYSFFKRRFSYWARIGVGQETPEFPFGNYKDVIMGRITEVQLLDKIYNSRRERAVGLYYFWKPVLLVRDVDLVHTILVKDFMSFVDHPSISDLSGTDQIVKSLFTMRGSTWKDRRTKFSSSFTPKKVRECLRPLEDMKEEIAALLDSAAESGEDIELEDALSKYTMNNMTQTLYGIKSDAVSNPQSMFLRCGKELTQPSAWTLAKIGLYTLCPALVRLLGLVTFSPTIWHNFSSTVNNLLKDYQDHRPTKANLLDNLMNMLNKGDISKEEMAAHVFTFWEAGFDSSALTLSYALYELASRPDLQEELRREAANSDPTTSPLLDSVIHETLRKYPPSGVVKRECTVRRWRCGEDVAASKGDQVVVSVASLHVDPSHFPQGDLWDPVRPSPTTNRAYLAFGAGPRTCIGQLLGEASVKLGLLAVLTRYKVLPSSKPPPVFDPRTIFISIRPKHGVWVRLQNLQP